MNKNAIRKFATEARRELISRVSQRALKYGISDKEVGNPNDDSVNGHLLSSTEKKQRAALIAQIKEKGYEQVMEEVAYTWFNRFSALRFMEVNGYLPTRVRVFTDENNAFKPQILTEAIHMELDGLDMEKVYAYKEANDDDELYKYLLITQCNALNSVLPGMFQKIADYTELLFPDNLLREGSVIEQMVSKIPEDNFDINSENGQLEILGWLYQYYISERHEEVVNINNKGAVKKEDIPAATQLFTTDWVVRYIVDNSLGRYWIERNPSSHLSEHLEYYIDGEVTDKNEPVRPEQITFFDPCIGSGHFAIYAFDVLMDIYTEYGYSQREATASIVKNNIFGVDIDNRAAQLAYFSIIMKACQYDRRFLNRNVQPNIFPIPESNHVDNYSIDIFCDGDDKVRAYLAILMKKFYNAKEIGSLISISDIEIEPLYKRLNDVREKVDLFSNRVIYELEPIIKVADILMRKYSVVATNPPYLNRYNDTLKEYLTTNYKDYSGDLFSAFMYRNLFYTERNGYTGFMTPFVWMFIKSYEKLRDYIIKNKNIASLIQFEYSAYEEATVPICTFVLKNNATKKEGYYIKLSDFKGGMNVQRQKTLEALRNRECGYFYETNMNNYLRIDGHPIAFWASEKMLCAFENFPTISALAPPKQGLATAKNDLFLKLWFEPSFKKIGIGMHSSEEAYASGYKWFPYNKGGAFRRWYGNRDYVVNWENDGYEIKNFKDENGKVRSRPQNLVFYFHQSITWSDITSASFSGRYTENGFMFDIKGSSGFPEEDKIYYILGFLNSTVSQKCIKILNPTITTQVGDMARIPVAFDSEKQPIVENLVKENISISQKDWDFFETSWDFQHHPLIRKVPTIAEAFDQWQAECDERFNQLKANEEELNRIFIDIYGLQDELTPEVEDKDVTVRKADLGRDIRSFISYAVGCMFGRYSLYKDGLIFAGEPYSLEAWVNKINDQPGTISHEELVRAYCNEGVIVNEMFFPDEDNIIPICDDEYFEDDIVGLFVKFVKTVYGADTLDENLKFIADALGGKGQPKEVIRNYFMNGFYTDHCKTYHKRPIYWLFDSGKKNGFKALIYMHRYQPDTIARIRTDYVHEQQARYRTAIADLETRIANASTSERVKLNKQLKTLNDQATEIHEYEEKIHHLADQMISIDLDDGVKVNYAKFQDVLAKIK